MADVSTSLRAAIAAKIAAVVADPNVPAQSAAIGPIVDGLDGILQQILHSTNNEPWYYSRVTLGSILSLVGIVLLSFFNISFSADDQKMVLDLILACIPIVGSLYALYGRWKAKVPIASPVIPTTAATPPPANPGAQ